MIDAKRNAPAANEGESGTHEGHQPIAYSLVPTAADFPERIRLSARADAFLDRLANAYALGVIGLDRMQGGLLALVLAAAENGDRAIVQRLTERLARVEREADVWYWVAQNPGKRPGDLYADTTREFWRQGADI